MNRLQAPKSAASTLAMGVVLACVLAGCGNRALDIDPRTVSSCLPMRPQSIKVEWDARGRDAKRLVMAMGKPGEQNRRFWFATTELSGTRTTGNWGVDGTTFYLSDANGHEIARRTLEATPCTNPGRKRAERPKPGPASTR